MLSQALKGGVSSSSITSLGLAASSHSSQALLSDLQCSLENEAQLLHVSVEEDDADTPKFSKQRASHNRDEDAEQEEPFWSQHGDTADEQQAPFSGSDGIDALCRSFVANSLSLK